MALTNCPECSKKISDTVERCPHCGMKIKSSPVMKKFIIFLFLFATIIIAFSVIKNKIQENIQTITNSDSNKNNNLSVLSLAQKGLKVERVWSEGQFTYAIVTWTNTTGNVLRNVTIQAIAKDKENNTIEFNQRSFFEHERGPLQPGFTGSLRIPINTGYSKCNSVSCSVVSAN